METRKLILCCAASAAVSALIAVTATAAAIREEVQPPQLPEQSQPPAVQPESHGHEYILGEWEGRLAVYRPGNRNRIRCWMSILVCCRRQMPRHSGRESRWKTRLNWTAGWKIL